MLTRSKIAIGSWLLLTAFTASSADSTITVSGRVLDFGCTISTESSNFTVDLLRHSAKQFPSVGSTSEAVPFQIILSDCSQSTSKVRVSFSGGADTQNTALLKLDEGTSTANGLGIEILDSTKTLIPVNTPLSSLSWIELTPEKSNALSFFARLMATNVPVQPGKIYASASFTLEFQ